MRKRAPHLSPASLVALVIAVLAVPASGADGVLEISQAKVLATGGFPFTISAPGSYVLTSNLQVADVNTTAIQISADPVTLDLNGFSILGPVVCGTGTTCSGQGSGDGIRSDSGTLDIRIRNGTIRGMGGDGIDLDGLDSSRSHIQNVFITSNGGNGIDVGVGRATVSGCNVSLNGLDGMIAVQAFGLGSGRIIAKDNVVAGNGGDGISCLGGDGCLIVNNAIERNNGHGFEAIQVSGSIQASNGHLVIGNTVTQNKGNGLRFNGATSGYTNNVIFSNGIIEGPVSGGRYLGPNLCDGVESAIACDPE